MNFSAGNYEKTIKIIENILTLNKENMNEKQILSLKIRIGQSLQFLKEYEKSIEYFESIIKEYPKHYLAYQRYSYIL
jgi:tetratricopeptide (TPR) repeat protein